PHKGTALVEAMRHIGAEAAFYVGDDDTDEDVFSLPEGNIVTVRVGRRAGSRAQFFLQRQRDINRLLRRLVSLEEKRSHS
ncbi:MAG: trehalose-phosphatase, partial [Bdellovibrionales bacterium]|nr:trehalose-phosphatase [Bdellovibrionales bacterium]